MVRYGYSHVVTATLTFSQLGLTTGGLAKSGGASLALNDGRGVGEDSAVGYSQTVQSGRGSVKKKVEAQKETIVSIRPITPYMFNIHSRDGKAPRALDVHEERVGLRDNLLELVGTSLNRGRSVDEVDGENLGASS